MRSYLPAVEVASRVTDFPAAGTPAGTVAIRAADLRVHGEVVTAGDGAPATGDMTLFCRPVLSAPALVRRDGRVLADAWLPDLVRLGELEGHLGDGVIEAVVEAALGQGRLRPRQRRRIMSYPLVIRLMIAMALMPALILSFRVRRGCDLRRPVVDSVADETLAALSWLSHLSGSLPDRTLADRWSPSARAS